MRTSTGKRLLSLLLTLAFCLGLLPATALAGASEPMALYYDGNRSAGASEWDYGSTDGYLEQDSEGKVKLSLSGGVPEGNVITAAYLVTADSNHSRKGTIYENGTVPSGAEGGAEGSNGIWVQNVVLSLEPGFYQTEYVTDHGSMYSVDFVDGDFFTPGTVQVVERGEAPDVPAVPAVQKPDLTAAALVFDTAVAETAYDKSLSLTAVPKYGGTLSWTVNTVGDASGLTVALTGGDDDAVRSVRVSGTPASGGTVTVTVSVTETSAEHGDQTSQPVTLYLSISVPQKYPVSFYLNGGSGAPGASYEDRQIISGQTVTLPADPVRQGYHFRGWFCSADAHIYGAGEQAVITRKTYFTAQWEAKGGAQVSLENLTVPVVGYVYLVALNEANPRGTSVWGRNYDAAIDLSAEVRTITVPFWDIVFNTYTALELRAQVDGEYRTIARYTGEVGAEQAGETLALVTADCAPYSLLSGLTVKTAPGDVLTADVDYSSWTNVRDAETSQNISLPCLTAGGKTYLATLTGKNTSDYYTTQDWSKTYTASLEGDRLTVTLDAVAPSVTVSGQVTNDGSPAVGVTVRATQYFTGQDRRTETVTDEDGRYSLLLFPSEQHPWDEGWYTASFSVLTEGRSLRISTGDSLKVEENTTHDIALGESTVTVKLQFLAREGQEDLARRYMASRLGRLTVQLRSGENAASDERTASRSGSLTLQEFLTPYSWVPANGAVTAVLNDPAGFFGGELSKSIVLDAGLGSVTLKPSLNPGALVTLSSQSRADVFLAWYQNDAYVSRTDSFTLFSSPQDIGAPAPEGAGTYTLVLFPASYSSLLRAGNSFDFTAFSALPEGAAIKSWTVTLSDKEIGELGSFQIDQVSGEAARYVTKPASTITAGAESYSSTDDIITFTGTIGLDPGLKEGRLTTLIIDPTSFSGQNGNDNMTLSVESVAVGGRVYAPGRPVDHDDQYYIDFPEGVELPCQYTIYAHPQTYRLNMEIEVNAHVSHDGITDYWQRIGQASVARPGLVITTPSAYVCQDTIPVSGTARKYETVTIYDNGEEVGKATASYDGRWNAQVKLPGTDPALTTHHSLTAVSSGGAESLPLAVFHRADMPQLTSLTMSWGHRNSYRYSVNIPGEFYNFTGAMYDVSFRAAFHNPDRLWQIDPVEGSSATAEAGLPPFKVLFRVTTSDGNIRLLTSNAPDENGVFEVGIDETLYSSVVAVDCEFYPLPELMDNYDGDTATVRVPARVSGELAQSLDELLATAGKNLDSIKADLAALEPSSQTYTFDDTGKIALPEGVSEDSEDAEQARLFGLWFSATNGEVERYTHETKSTTTLNEWLDQLAAEYAGFDEEAYARYFTNSRIYADEESFRAEQAWVESVAESGNDLHLTGLDDATYDGYTISDFSYENGEAISGSYQITVDFTSYQGLYLSTTNVTVYGGFTGFESSPPEPGYTRMALTESPGSEKEPTAELLGITRLYFYNGDYQCTTSVADVISGICFWKGNTKDLIGNIVGMFDPKDMLKPLKTYLGLWADALGGLGAILDAMAIAADLERDHKMHSDLIELMSTPCYMKLDGEQKAKCEAMYQDFLGVMEQRQKLDILSKIGNFFIVVMSSGLFANLFNAGLSQETIEILTIDYVDPFNGLTMAEKVAANGGKWTAVGSGTATFATISAIVSGLLAMTTASETHTAIAKAYNSTFKYISFLCSQKAAEMEDPNCKKKKEKEKEEEVKPVPNNNSSGNQSAGYIAAVAGGRIGVQNDPSGVVYEAVIQNPVEGAIVTLYYGADEAGQMKSRTDTDTARILPAADVAHMTPAASTQVTGADGRFQWFVPEGQWYVAAQRAGYQDGNSDADAAATIALSAGIPVGSQTVTNMLPVLPVQLDVNIPLVDAAAPYVTDVQFVAEDGIYVTFSKYMDEAAVTDPANYLIDDDAFTGSVSVVESLRGNTPENRGAPVTYYTKGVKLTPADTSSGTAVTLTVRGGAGTVLSYAATPMTADYTVTGEMAAADRLSCQPQFTDYSTDGSRTSVASQVDAGTKVALSLPSDAPEGAQIYYTTDGTVPTNGSRLYTGPIPVTEDTTVRAVAALAGYGDSEVSQGSFTISVAPTLLFAISGKVIASDNGSPDGLSLTLTGGGISRTAVISDGGYRFPNLPRDTAYQISFAGDGTYQPFSMTVALADSDVSQNIRLIAWEPEPEYWDEEETAPETSQTTEETTTPETPAEPERPFTDVLETSWFYDAVYYCYDKGYFKGTSEEEFTPGDTMTREMFAAVLYRIAGEPELEGEKNAFSDVPDGKYYTDAVLWASGEGIIQGYGDGTFGTGDPVTREQMVVLFWRLSGKPAAEEADLSAFADAEEIHSWAWDAFAWAVGAGVVRGKGNGILDPRGDATRAEVAQIVMNYDTIVNAPAEKE